MNGEETGSESSALFLLVVPSLFALGQIVTTPGAEAALAESGVLLQELIARHAMADWGNLDEQDWAANDAAVLNENDRILSIYQLPEGQTIWIITEIDRSATTALLPSEY